MARKRPAAAALAAMARRHGKRGAASEAAEEAADIAIQGHLAKGGGKKPRRKTPKSTQGGRNRTELQTPKGTRPRKKPTKRPPNLVVIKKDKHGNWVPQPVPKPQWGPSGLHLIDPKKKRGKRKPAPK